MDNENLLSPDEDIIPPSENDTETPPEPDKEPEGSEEGNAKSCIHTWTYQTIPHFYDRVRTNLNVGSLIENDTIDFFENAPMAEIAVKNRVSNYEELDGVKQLLFETCIVYMACFNLCPLAQTMRITRQKDPSLELEFASSSNSEENPCQRFLWMVDDLVSQINEEEIQSFFGFKVTKGSGTVKPCWPHSRSAYTPLWSEK